jgi:hypothetical protein
MSAEVFGFSIPAVIDSGYNGMACPVAAFL